MTHDPPSVASLPVRLEADQSGRIVRQPAGQPVECQIAHWWPAAHGEICHLSRRLTPEPGTGTDLACLRSGPDGTIHIDRRRYRGHGAAPIVLTCADGAPPALQGALPAR
jgi:hypothetical protein